MKTLAQLLQTKRMFYLPMYNVNSLKGLYDMIQEIVADGKVTREEQQRLSQAIEELLSWHL